MTLDPIEVAWAAGLFEGEGTCYYGEHVRVRDSGKEDPYTQRLLRIQMTDLEPLERFKEAFGLGRIYGPYGGTQPTIRFKRKVYWAYQASKRPDVEFILTTLMPHLSPRRQRQALACLEGRIWEEGRTAQRLELEAV